MFRKIFIFAINNLLIIYETLIYYTISTQYIYNSPVYFEFLLSHRLGHHKVYSIGREWSALQNSRVNANTREIEKKTQRAVYFFRPPFTIVTLASIREDTTGQRRAPPKAERERTKKM